MLRGRTCIIVRANAHASEKRKNTESETMRTTLRPKTSDQRPYNGVKARLCMDQWR